MSAASGRNDLKDLEDDDQVEATLGHSDMNLPYNEYTRPVISHHRCLE